MAEAQCEITARFIFNALAFEVLINAHLSMYHPVIFWIVLISCSWLGKWRFNSGMVRSLHMFSAFFRSAPASAPLLPVGNPPHPVDFLVAGKILVEGFGADFL